MGSIWMNKMNNHVLFSKIAFTKLQNDLLIFNNGRFPTKPPMYHGAFAQNVDPIEADVMAIAHYIVA